MKTRFAVLAGVALLLGGCESRSISDSGYHGGSGYYHHGGYIGELADARSS